MSWIFVFGAVATLLYTSFRPFWHELLAGEFPPDQIGGTVAEYRESGAPAQPQGEGPGAVVADAACGEQSVRTDGLCVAKNP